MLARAVADIGLLKLSEADEVGADLSEVALASEASLVMACVVSVCVMEMKSAY
jgi:hypothetical protein